LQFLVHEFSCPPRLRRNEPGADWRSGRAGGAGGTLRAGSRAGRRAAGCAAGVGPLAGSHQSGACQGEGQEGESRSVHGVPS